jgi:UTP-glucose-1-phosphate uridylyltransferase
VGRYVLDRAILDRLTCTPWGDLGQEQLTAAIDADARHVPLTAFRFAGQHFPCSGHDGLLAATQARRRIVRQAGAKNVTPARMGSHRGCHGPTPPSYRA